MEIASLVGRTLNRKYSIKRLIGVGGMGQVYEAEHLVLRKAVAIKMLDPAYKISQVAYEQFKLEARIGGALSDSANIVQILDFEHTEENVPYLVMELLCGEDLGEFLGEDGGLDIVQTVALFGGVFAGIQHAHEKGVVHRDLKPSNIFLCQQDDGKTMPKVMDFGISKLLELSKPLTRNNEPFGTPHYMTPEQVAGAAKDADARLDIFALGAILYRVLGKRVPFAGSGNVLTVMSEIAQKHPRPLHEVNPTITPEVSRVVHRALAKKPRERYQTVGELSRALTAAVGTVPQEQIELTLNSLPVKRRPEPPPTAPTPEDCLASQLELGSDPGSLVEGGAVVGVRPSTIPDPGSRPLLLEARTGVAATPARRKPTAAGSTYVVMLGAAILLGGLWWGIWGRASTAPVSAAVELDKPTAETSSGPPPKAAAPGKQVLSSTVKITLRGLPGVYGVTVNGKKMTGNPLVLGRTRRPHRLTVWSPGHARFKRVIVPDRDRSVKVRLRRQGSKRSGAAALPATKKKSSIPKAVTKTEPTRTTPSKTEPAKKRAAEDRREVEDGTLNFE